MILMTSTPEEFNVFCNSIALIYHESRNVRHLINKNLLNPEPWRFLVSLPTNPENAWREIAQLRDKALQRHSAVSALKVFESRFHICLLDLPAMFANENWRHAKGYGGNAWAAIAELALQLADALRTKDTDLAFKTAIQLQNIRHNNGSVQEKLSRLEKARDNTST